MSAPADRDRLLRRGLWLEYVTLGWNAVGVGVRLSPTRGTAWEARYGDDRLKHWGPGISRDFDDGLEVLVRAKQLVEELLFESRDVGPAMRTAAPASNAVARRTGSTRSLLLLAMRCKATRSARLRRRKGSGQLSGKRLHLRLFSSMTTSWHARGRA